MSELKLLREQIDSGAGATVAVSAIYTNASHLADSLDAAATRLHSLKGVNEQLLTNRATAKHATRFFIPTFNAQRSTRVDLEVLNFCTTFYGHPLREAVQTRNGRYQSDFHRSNWLTEFSIALTRCAHSRTAEKVHFSRSGKASDTIDHISTIYCH